MSVNFNTTNGSSQASHVMTYSEKIDISHLQDALARQEYEKIIQDPQLFWLTFCIGYGSSQASHVMNHSEKIDISHLQDPLAREEYEKIIQDPQLLSLTFCNSYSKMKVQFDDFSYFFPLKNCLPYHDKVKNYVEKIRNLLVTKSVEKKDFTICSLDETPTHVFYQIESDPFVFNSEMIFAEIDNRLFISIIEPSVPHFFNLLGLGCRNDEVILKGFRGPSLGTSFKVQWKEGHFPPRITPKPIPRRDFQKDLYSMYIDESLCDLTLVTKDGTIKIHSVPLFLCGGEAIQKMLTSNMKESLTKIVSFDQYSIATVKAFVDFIYLGESALAPKVFFNKGVDVYELLDMAHTYQIKPLIDCCTNLLNVSANTSDAENIKNLADRYDNEHLKELYKFLCLDPNKNLLKV